MRNTHRGQRPFVQMADEEPTVDVYSVLACCHQCVTFCIGYGGERGVATAWFGQRKMVYGGVKFVVNDDQFRHVTEGVNVLNPARQFTPVERVVRSLKAHLAEPIVRGPQFMSLPPNRPRRRWKGSKSLLKMNNGNDTFATVAQNIKCNGPLNQVGINGELLIKPRRA